MSGKTEKDKQKALQEKHQAILFDLLKLEDNKYCVDCDAKGEPTWLYRPYRNADWPECRMSKMAVCDQNADPGP